MNPENQTPSEPESALERRMAAQPWQSPPPELRARVLAAAVRGRTDLPATAVAVRTWWDGWLGRMPLSGAVLTCCGFLLWVGSASDRWVNGVAESPVTAVSRERWLAAASQRQQWLAREPWDVDEFSRPAPIRRPTPTDLPPLRPRSERRRPSDPGWGLGPEPAGEDEVRWFSQVSVVRECDSLKV